MAGRWLAAAALVLGALTPAAQAPTSGQLTVTVREAGSGRALADVPVTVRLEHPPSTEGFKPPPGFQPPYFVRTTGVDGTLVIDALLPGTYRLGVDSPDHLSSESRDSPVAITSHASAPGAVIDEPGAGVVPVRAGARDSVVFDVPRAAAIRGHVLTLDGTPAAGVAVELLRLMPVTAFRQFSMWPPATSDAKGSFRFAQLQPGTYYLWTVSESGRGHRFNDVYFPGMPEPAKAMPVEAAAGKDATVALLAPFAPRPTLRGKVAPELAAAGAGLTIRRLTDLTGDHVTLAEVPPVQSGQFAVHGLRGGTYLLQARPSDGSHDKVLAQTVVEIGASDATDTVLAPPVPSRLRARLDLPAGVTLDWSAVDLGFVAVDGVPETCRTERSGAGSYLLRMMPPSRCRAYLTGPDGWFAEAVVMGDGTNLLLQPARFEEGRDYGELTVKLTNQGARLTGRIPEALIGMRDLLHIAPEDRRYSEHAIKTVDALDVRDDGSFEARVAPGLTYLVGLCTGRCRSSCCGLPSPTSHAFQRTATRVAVDRPGTFSVTVRDPR